MGLDTRGAGRSQRVFLCLRAPQHRVHLRPRATRGRSSTVISIEDRAKQAEKDKHGEV